MQHIINLYKKISNKSYSTLAGSIAFFLIVNGGSVFFLIISICSKLGYDIFNYVEIEYLPKQLTYMIEILYVETISTKRSIFYSLTSIISGSTLFYHLIKISEIIYEEKLSEINFLNRIFSIILVIIFLLIIVLSFVVFLILSLLTKQLGFNVILKYLTMFFIPFVVVLFINKVVTNRNKISDIILGVLFSTMFWFIATIGFSIFLNIFLNFKNNYGALSFFIVFMVWTYLLSQGLIIGFIINHYFSLKKVNNHTIIMAHGK